MTPFVNHWPPICGSETDVAKLFPVPEAPARETVTPNSKNVFNQIQSCFGVALHMHQPTILEDTEDLQTAGLISNLQYMLEHPNIGDNHNAPVFLHCYSRISDIIRDLTAKGYTPRIMLDYSGNLLWGLEQMGQTGILDNLKRITSDPTYSQNVEWLGTMWSHAVVSSTPIPDIKLQVIAWRRHFASIFGVEAVKRVKGFSAPEMHLPVHPDVCYKYIKALKECGYEWLLVQEHTVETLDGGPVKRPFFPHRLVAKNSGGQVEEIPILIKTKGSDTKLVGQMQPYAEARSLAPQLYGGIIIPPLVIQIGDGENGGVMMNEFPQAYYQTFREIEPDGAPGRVAPMNGSEYLELVKQSGLQESSFTPVQPISQHKIWRLVTGFSPDAANEAIQKIRETDPEFNLDRGSWTNDRSWVQGYEEVLDPMNRFSVMFHRQFDSQLTNHQSRQYQEALLYLLLSETSCFRYWGAGRWTEYAKEICRRGMEVLNSGPSC
ncbi:MAG TPA: glycosyl hydrolase family 57 [Bacillota bacterium]|nr:glycosyl hydrolase family 57 [Bacillota bacterium]